VYISVVCVCACPSHSDTLRRSLVAWSTVKAQVCYVVGDIGATALTRFAGGRSSTA
jgi:hypothetical protein